MPCRVCCLPDTATLVFGRQLICVQVYESQKSYKPQGSVIALAVNCQNALEAVHPSLLSRYSTNQIAPQSCSGLQASKSGTLVQGH